MANRMSFFRQDGGQFLSLHDTIAANDQQTKENEGNRVGGIDIELPTLRALVYFLRLQAKTFERCRQIRNKLHSKFHSQAQLFCYV